MHRILSSIKEVRWGQTKFNPWGTFEFHEYEYNMTVSIISVVTHAGTTIFNHKATQRQMEAGFK